MMSWDAKSVPDSYQCASYLGIQKRGVEPMHRLISNQDVIKRHDHRFTSNPVFLCSHECSLPSPFPRLNNVPPKALHGSILRQRCHNLSRSLDTRPAWAPSPAPWAAASALLPLNLLLRRLLSLLCRLFSLPLLPSPAMAPNRVALPCCSVLLCRSEVMMWMGERCGAGKGAAAKEAGGVENTFMREVVELHDKYMEASPVHGKTSPVQWASVLVTCMLLYADASCLPCLLSTTKHLLLRVGSSTCMVIARSTAFDYRSTPDEGKMSQPSQRHQACGVTLCMH